MKKYLLSYSLLAATFFAGCRKDVVTNTTSVNDESQATNFSYGGLNTNKTVSNAHWYGSYLGVSGLNPNPAGDPIVGTNETSVYVGDSDFIKNGVAELPHFSRGFSFSNISFDIPSDYNISGDSVIYKVVVKNPMSGSFYDYDVVIQLYGDQHMAELHFVADASAQQYAQYYVGNAKISNLPQSNGCLYKQCANSQF